MNALAILVLSVAGLASPARAQDSDAKVFPAKGIESLAVDTEAGDIEVRSGGPEIRVEVTKADPDHCRVTMEPKGGTLRLVAERAGRMLFWRHTCETGFRVTAPAKFAAVIATVSGKTAVAGLTGGLLLKSVSGRVRLKDAAGPLKATTTSGDIEGSAASEDVSITTVSGDVRLEGLLGVAAAESTSGDIRLQWSRAPLSGTVNVETVSGEIELAFPAKTKLEAKVQTISGKQSNQIGDTPEARLRVKVESVSGDVTIARAKPR